MSAADCGPARTLKCIISAGIGAIFKVPRNQLELAERCGGKAVAWKLQLDLPGNQKLVVVNFLVNLQSNFFFLVLYCTKGEIMFPRMRLHSCLKRMKTGRWCLLFRQMKLVCWRADVQAPALPAFSWKGEAKRSTAAAAAAAAAAGSWGHKYLPLTDAPTNMSSLQRGSKSYLWRRCVWLIQRQESGARRHQPEDKLHVSDIYRASESFLNLIFMPLDRFATVVILVTCDVWWQQNWAHRLLLLIEGDDQLRNNSGSDWNAGQSKHSETE